MSHAPLSQPRNQLTTSGLKQRSSKSDEDATGTVARGDASNEATEVTTGESILAEGSGASDDATVLDLGPGVNEVCRED